MRRNDITVVIGRKESGKSTFARSLMPERRRRIIVDPMREHADQGVVIEDFDSLAAYLRARRFQDYAVAYWSLDEDEIMAAIALGTTGTPDAPPLPGVTYFLDEVDRLMSPSSTPEPLSRLINYGRHFGASAVAIARRFKAFPLDWRANMDRIAIFATMEPDDVAHLERTIGPELAERVRAIARVGERVTWPDDLPQLEGARSLAPPSDTSGAISRPDESSSSSSSSSSSGPQNVADPGAGSYRSDTHQTGGEQ